MKTLRSSLPYITGYVTTRSINGLCAHFQKDLGPLGVAMRNSITNNTLFLATDGSHSPSLCIGSHGWVFTWQTTPIWRGNGPTDGHPHLISPYRAELSGLVAGLHVLQSVCVHYNIEGGKVILYSDCYKAIKALKPNYQGIAKYLADESDLIVEATSLLSNIPLTIDLVWVKSHFTGPDRPSVMT